MDLYGHFASFDKNLPQMVTTVFNRKLSKGVNINQLGARGARGWGRRIKPPSSIYFGIFKSPQFKDQTCLVLNISNPIERVVRNVAVIILLLLKR